MKEKEINRIAAEICAMHKKELGWGLYTQSDIKSWVTASRFPDLKGNIQKIRDRIFLSQSIKQSRSFLKQASPPKRTKEALIDRLILKKLNANLKEIYPLKTYSGKWAGGSNHFKVRHQESLTPSFDVQSDKVWSDNGKWAGLDGYFYLTMNVFKQQFDVIGGLLTITTKSHTGREKECWWLEQSRGYTVKLVQGYLIRGYHIAKTAKVNSLEAARLIVGKRRTEAARRILKSREKNFAHRINSAQKMQLLSTIWITPQDSIDAGNCPAGTHAFRKRYQQKHGYGNVGAVRADELYYQANGNTHYVNRIIRHKTGITI